MLRKLSVRGKILAALAVPVLVLGLAATLFSLQAFQAARVASQAESVVALLPAERAVVDALSVERELAVQVAAGGPASDQLADAKTATDQKIAALRTELAALDTSALDPSVSSRISTVLTVDDEDLLVARDATMNSVLSPLEVADKYTSATAGILAIPASLSATLTDRALAMDLDAYVASVRALDQVRAEGPLVQVVLDQVAAGTGGENGFGLGDLGNVVSAADVARSTAVEKIGALGAGLTVPQPGTGYSSMHTQVQTNNAGSILPATAAGWAQAQQAEVDALTPIVTELQGVAVDAAADETSSRQTTALYTLGAAVLTLLASVAIALVISRRITVPLRHLTEAAGAVRAQLPQLVEQVSVPGDSPQITLEPIKVESGDEVGQLAAAFNDVNHATVEVAKEQAALRGSIAEMFVNVARRDHVLLNRQLAFLDELERSEEDAGTLANLFRLDHLATRMRRNSESLLVLAGIDSGRRVRQPMPVSDVVRTASSEIELYDRVRLNLEADPLMLGHNALNAAHLLAELLENATMFSEPNTPVEVTTSRTARTVNVEVRDHGLGMSLHDIDEANAKVDSRSAADVIGVQRLGLFVVGRLSERLGAQVTFARTPDGSAGTVVTVALPLSLFLADSDVPMHAPVDPLSITPAPAEQAPAQPAWTLPEAEPEVGYPVDLDALTDGETSTGMPRRRTVQPPTKAPEPQPFYAPAAAAAQPAAPTYEPEPDASGIVLPPLESANPAIALSNPDDLSWAPATTPAPALPGRLPSRSRSEAPAPTQPVLPSVEDQPLLDDERRSAMFSSFRTLGSAEGTPGVPADEVPSAPAEVSPAVPPAGAHAFAPEEVADDLVASDLPTFAVPGLEPDLEWGTATGAHLAAPAAVEASQDPDEPFFAPSFEPETAFEELPSFDAQAFPGFEPETAFEELPSFDAQAFPGFQPETAFEELPTFGEATSAFEPERPFAFPPVDGGLASHAAEQPQQASPYVEPEPMFPSTQAFVGDLRFGQDDGLAVPAYEPMQAFEPLETTGRPAPAAPEAPLSDSLLSQLADSSAPAFEPAPAFEASAPFDPLTAFEPATPFSTLVDPEAEPTVAPAVFPLPERRAASVQDLPVVRVPSQQAAPAEQRPAAVGLQAASFEPTLPSFADVVADAPTRRAARGEPEGKKRGLFGRKKRAKGPAQAPAAPAVGAFPTFTRSAQPAEAAPELASTRFPTPGGADLTDDPIGYAPTQVVGQASAERAADEPSYSAWTPSAPVPVVAQDEEVWAPAQTAFDEAPVPLRDLPLSGLDSGESWAPAGEIRADASSMLAMRSSIQEQALAELSQLSAYHPTAVDTGQGGGLARRTRGQVADSTDDLASQKISRDAAELRSRLSAFQSATTLGRQVPAQQPSESYGGPVGLSSDITDAPYVPDSAPQSR